MKKIRVLVVEDSPTVRGHLLDVLSTDPEFEVVAAEPNGQRGVEACRTLRPDVITLDMNLPVMDGVSATEHIMGHFPTPILIVSSSINRGDLFKTYDALAAGAVDVLEKPRGDEAEGAWERKFLAALKLVSRIRVITHPRARLAVAGFRARSGPPPPGHDPAPRGSHAVIAIGASTGGPGALVDVLRPIPRGIAATIVVVLHIDEPFGAAFADWLTSQTSHPVTYVRDGEPVLGAPGRVLMAPPGRHVVARGGQLRLSSEPERHSCRPSIDVLFESLAVHSGRETLGCLLTGMGRDGALGLLRIREAGGLTIAQDEATSVVYGMPREAALLGAAERILPLGEIGPTITRVTTNLEP